MFQFDVWKNHKRLGISVEALTVCPISSKVVFGGKSLSIIGSGKETKTSEDVRIRNYWSIYFVTVKPTYNMSRVDITELAHFCLQLFVKNTKQSYKG